MGSLVVIEMLVGSVPGSPPLCTLFYLNFRDLHSRSPHPTPKPHSRKQAWLRRVRLDDLGSCAAPKRKGKSKMGLFERQRGAPPLLRKEAILAWDQLQRVGERNLGLASSLIWQADLLQRLARKEVPTFLHRDCTGTCAGL